MLHETIKTYANTLSTDGTSRSALSVRRLHVFRLVRLLLRQFSLRTNGIFRKFFFYFRIQYKFFRSTHLVHGNTCRFNFFSTKKKKQKRSESAHPLHQFVFALVYVRFI